MCKVFQPKPFRVIGEDDFPQGGTINLACAEEHAVAMAPPYLGMDGLQRQDLLPDDQIRVDMAEPLFGE